MFFTNFNKQLAIQHYGVDNEADLRKKIYGTRSACNDEEIDLLKKYVHDTDQFVYGEVGVYFGGTFKQMIDHIDSTCKNYHCYGFDLFEDLEMETFGVNQTHELRNKWNILNVAYRDNLDETLKEMGCNNYTLVKGSSDDSLAALEVKFDLVFIDGNHTYAQCKKDFEASLKKCKKNAVIVFDNSSNDINPDPQYVEIDGGPWKVCQELMNDDRVEFLDKVLKFTSFRVK